MFQYLADRDIEYPRLSIDSSFLANMKNVFRANFVARKTYAFTKTRHESDNELLIDLLESAIRIKSKSLNSNYQRFEKEWKDDYLLGIKSIERFFYCIRSKLTLNDILVLKKDSNLTYMDFEIKSTKTKEIPFKLYNNNTDELSEKTEISIKISDALEFHYSIYEKEAILYQSKIRRLLNEKTGGVLKMSAIKHFEPNCYATPKGRLGFLIKCDLSHHFKWYKMDEIADVLQRLHYHLKKYEHLL
jgi:hypothetical protein